MAVQTITLPAPTNRRSGFVEWRIPFFGSGSYGQIDTDLVAQGETAYLVTLAFNAIAGFTFVDFHLAETDVTPSGGGVGPSLTSVVLTDGTLTLAYGGTSVAFGNNLLSTDTSEPYRWTLLNQGLSNQLANVTNAIANNAGATLTINDGQVIIPPATPSWEASPPTSLPMQAGKAFSYTVPTAQGHPQPAYTASGLPGGITFDPDSLVISGTPTAEAEGSGTIVITAENSQGTATFSIPWMVSPAPPPPPVTSGDGVVVVGDQAGGAIGNTRSIRSTLNGSVIAVAGDGVASHAPCPIPASHCAANTTASPSVTINGIRIVVNGDAATCGHPAQATNRSLIG